MSRLVSSSLGVSRRYFEPIMVARRVINVRIASFEHNLMVPTSLGNVLSQRGTQRERGSLEVGLMLETDISAIPVVVPICGSMALQL